MPVNPKIALSSGQVLQAVSAESDPLHWHNDFVHETVMHTYLVFVKLAEKLTLFEWHSVKTFEICPSVIGN